MSSRSHGRGAYSTAGHRASRYRSPVALEPPGPTSALREETGSRFVQEPPAHPVDVYARLRQRVTQEPSAFELPALLQALELLGYPLEHIRLVSNRSLLSGAGLVQEVRLHTEPSRAEVRLNLGLLAPDGPLPSYFNRLFQDPDIDEVQLEGFLQAFDHELLFRHVQGLMPSRVPALMPLAEALQHLLVPMLQPSAPATLEWLLRKVFPELLVSVRRRTGDRASTGTPLTLGTSRLSQGDTLNGRWSSQASCLSVRLLASEAVRLDGRLWQEEAAERLSQRILPMLSHTETLLEVVLVVPGEASGIRLEALGEGPSVKKPGVSLGEQTRLGYQALGASRGQAVELLLFLGCPNDLLTNFKV